MTVEQHPARHIAEKGGCRLISVGSEVEMNVGRTDLRMVCPRGAAGQEDITEVDEAPQGDKGHEDGLLEADGMGPIGLLLEDSAPADVGT